MNFLKILIITSLLLVTFSGTTEAVSVVDAKYQATISITNSSGHPQANVEVPLPISINSLVDGGYSSASGRDVIIKDSDGDDATVAVGNLVSDILYAKQDNGGVFTDYTTEATNATINDVVLLPTVPVAEDAFYIGLANRSRYVSIAASTAGVGVWTITWEYYNGTVWSTLPGIADGTVGFTVSGTRQVGFSLPTNWEQSVIDGNTAWWIRGRVSSFTSVVTPPLGDRIRYETAVFWLSLPWLPDATTLTYTLYTGGSFTKDSYPIIGAIAVPDDPLLEVGASNFTLLWEGCLDRQKDGALVEKVNSYSLSMAGGLLTGYVRNGATTNSVTHTITRSGFYKIELIRTGAVLSLEVDDIEKDTEAITINPADNANNLTANGDTVIYASSISLDAATSTVWSMKPTTIETDNVVSDATGTNDGTITLPDLILGLTAVVGSLKSISSTAIATPVPYAPIVPPLNIASLASCASIPLFGPLVQMVVDATGIHPVLVCTPIITTMAVGTMGAVFIFTSQLVLMPFVGILIYWLAWSAGWWDLYLTVIFSVITLGVLLLPMARRHT